MIRSFVVWYLKRYSRIIFKDDKKKNESFLEKELCKVFYNRDPVDCLTEEVIRYLVACCRRGDFELKTSYIYCNNTLEEKCKSKALDMASCLFEIQNNVWRKFKHTDYDYHPYMDAVNKCIYDHNINIEDLIE